MHLSEDRIIGLSVDINLGKTWQEQAKKLNYQIVNENRRSLISVIGTETIFEPNKLSFSLLNPFIDGEVISHNSNTLNQSFRITKQGISSKLAINTEITSTTPFLPVDSVITAKVQLQPGEGDLAVKYLMLSGNENARLVHEIKARGAQIVLGSDSAGSIFNLVIPDSELTIEELATIGNEIINRKSLSTTAWTIEDGTEVEEIRVEQNSVQSTIDSNNDFSFISLENTTGDQIRIVKTDTQVSFANRIISTEISQLSLTSSCLTDAHSYIKSEKHLNKNKDNKVFTPKLEQLFSGLNYFSEIAISNKKVRFCW